MLGDKIKVASLPEANESCPIGKHLIVSGWGQDVTRPFRFLEKLWAVGLQCLDPSSCPRLNDMNPKTNMICAGDPESLLSSACFGDSGGMLYHDPKLLLLVIYFNISYTTTQIKIVAEARYLHIIFKKGQWLIPHMMELQHYMVSYQAQVVLEILLKRFAKQTH